MCVEADNSHLQSNTNKLSKQTKLTIMPCQNKNTQLWHVDSSKKIRSRSDNTFCINMGEEVQGSDLQGLQMKASSCANDNQHNLQNVID